VPLRTHGRPYALALELIGASKRPVVLLFKRPGTSEERSRARRSAAENEDRSKGEFKEDPVGLRPGAKAATATGQWACPQCTFENAAALEGCGMCTFTPRRELLLAVGDEVTWKGSDDELPAGTVRPAAVFTCPISLLSTSRATTLRVHTSTVLLISSSARTNVFFLVVKSPLFLRCYGALVRRECRGRCAPRVCDCDGIRWGWW
jgi:hypothetical protein